MKVEKTMGKIGLAVFLVFRTFFLKLENNNTLKCSSDNFPCMMTYILCIEICPNCILMHSLFSNWEIVLEHIQIPWYQDLRVQHMDLTVYNVQS